MSLKKKTKIEHCTSLKGYALRQIDNEMKLEETKQQINQKQNEVKLLEKMENKMEKIMKAYVKLQEENRRKDQIIKQLEDQNLLLKQRILQKSQLGDSRLSKSHMRKQSSQNIPIQRTFTPMDVKTPPTFKLIKDPLLIDQTVSKMTETYNPSSSIVQQYNPKLPSTKILAQSRSVQSLKKPSFQYRIQPQSYQGKTKEKLSLNNVKEQPTGKVNQNNLSPKIQVDDKSFIDVLSKLKQKIQKFNEEESAPVKKPQNIVVQQEIFFNSNQSMILSKAKSSDNFSRNTNMKQSIQKQQLQALKKIRDQRDDQIKRMDELFSKIDERLNIS